jgi:hypothetical protein
MQNTFNFYKHNLFRRNQKSIAYYFFNRDIHDYSNNS